MAKKRPVKGSRNTQPEPAKKRKTLTSPPHPRWFRIAKVCLVIMLWLALSLTIIILAWEVYDHRAHGEHTHEKHEHKH